MKYNFDEIVDRAGTHCAKLDSMPAGAPEDCVSLWVADMDFACAPAIIDALHRRVDRRIFGYTRYDNDEYKSAVVGWFKRRYGWEIKKEHLMFSPGVVIAFTTLINVLSEPGDGVIIQRPVYYPFTVKIEANDRRVVNNALIYKDGKYSMDFEDLDKKFADPANKGILLCSPHNPAGRVWTEEELLKVVELAKKHKKWIISDEIHCDLTRTGIESPHLLKLAPEYSDSIFACTSPSKSFNLAGLTMSNIVIPNDEVREKYNEQLITRNGCDGISPFGQFAGIAAYNECEDWLDACRSYIDDNIAYVKAFVAEHLPKVVVPDTEGTYLMWLDFNAYCQDPKKLEHWMQNDARVALDEGYVFGPEGNGFERINVAAPRATIEECMNRIAGALPKLIEK